MFRFEITDQEYWKNIRGYSRNNGQVLDMEKLTTDLLEKIRCNVLLVSGDVLVDFGSIAENSSVQTLLELKRVELEKDVLVVNNAPDNKLRGKTLHGVKVRSLTGVAPYRKRL